MATEVKSGRGVESAASGWRLALVLVAAWVSLLGPPWQLLVTSSLPLYLNNQQELHHDVSILYPFVGVALAVATLALPLHFAALRNRRLARLLWPYYLCGLASLGAITLHQWQIAPFYKLAAISAFVSGFALALFILFRWADLRSVTGPLALFALGFVTVDGFEFATRYVELPEQLNAPASATSAAPAVRSDTLTARPNFYHIVFDEYQTEMFDITLDRELAEGLNGFVFFDDAVTVFGRTRMSLATIFSGRMYDFESSQLEFLEAAFSGPQSMLTRLRDAGYLTEAYLHDRLFRVVPPFDLVRVHQLMSPYNPVALDRLFRDLWVYANLPKFLSARHIDAERFANLEGQNVLDPAAPIKSLHTFEYLLRRERSQAATGRYVFAHLILPHFPNVLRSDCSYSLDGSKTRAEEQSICTNRLMLELVATLRELGRLHSSLVVFQADHGSRYAIQNGRLHRVAGMRDYGDEWHTARSRSLLLIKPPSADATGSLVRSSVPTSLLDVFPTAAAALELYAGDVDGVDLFDPDALLPERKRWYYFFQKKGGFGWTDEMMRFRVEDSRVVRDRVQTLVNNPRP